MNVELVAALVVAFVLGFAAAVGLAWSLGRPAEGSDADLAERVVRDAYLFGAGLLTRTSDGKLRRHDPRSLDFEVRKGENE